MPEEPSPDHLSNDELVELADASPESLIEACELRGWGDGLPLVPPTEDRVKAMLADTDGDPDEVLATLPPRLGEATRRSVAVNAVLAGCRPEWMPVAVAAVRALGQPELNLRGVNATTHPVAPLVVVHGVAVDELGFNAGLGAFGPGNRANASVGRAVRFVLLHVAGARPGAGDASTQGQLADRLADRAGASVSLVVGKGTAATPADPEILDALREGADLVLTGSAD